MDALQRAAHRQHLFGCSADGFRRRHAENGTDALPAGKKAVANGLENHGRLVFFAGKEAMQGLVDEGLAVSQIGLEERVTLHRRHGP